MQRNFWVFMKRGIGILLMMLWAMGVCAESEQATVAPAESGIAVPRESRTGMPRESGIAVPGESGTGMPAESVEHDYVLKAKVGGGYQLDTYQLDTYLSPLGYKGLQFGLGSEWWQPFRQDTKLGKAGKLVNWEHVGRADIGMARYISSAGSNMFWGFQIECGWGAYYRWKWIEDRLQVFVGPYLEGCFAARYHANNVNKPLSFDVAIDAMAMGGISWSFYGKKTSYRLQYTVRTNLIGFDYLPEYGESYYEITEGVPAVARCSGHWNHHTVEHDLSLDLQFPHTTWRIGAEHYFVYYNTKYMHFMRNQICLVVGCCWKYKTRANARL